MGKHVAMQSNFDGRSTLECTNIEASDVQLAEGTEDHVSC